MTPLVAARVAVVILAVLVAAPSAAWAQYSLFGFDASGEVAVGARFFPEKPSDKERTKFEEYRDMPWGLYLDTLNLRLAPADQSYEFTLGGANWGQNDQEYSLGLGRLGLWQGGFQWDETPHLFGTTARILSSEVDRGHWVLPTPRPNLFLHNGAESQDVETRWDTARFNFQFTPTPDLTFRADYTRIHKDGERPASMAFASPGGNFLEIPAPIDQTVQDFRLRFSFARPTWQLQGGYTFSWFTQGDKSYDASNPCFGNGAAVAAGGCAGDATGAQQTGLVSLEPSNQAHTWSLSGGVTLPWWRTRITGNMTYSIRFQDASFLPHTINPAIVNPGLALPESSLDGHVATLLGNLQITSRPIAPLTLTAKYRIFDLNDTSDQIIFPAHVVDDRTLTLEERLAGAWSYTRQNADLDAKYRIIEPLAAFLGGGWENWNRNSHREVKHSDEWMARAGFDVSLTDWLQGRIAYKPAFRRIGVYETSAHASHTVVEELTPDAIAQGQSPLLRKFDEADRNRQAGMLQFSITPIERLAATLTGELRSDEYYNSELGLQNGYSWSVGIDLNWRPIDRLALFGSYTHEVMYNKMRSRSRPVTGTVTNDFDDFDWMSFFTDTSDTLHVGADVAIIPGKLDWTGRFTIAYSLGEQDTRNPGPIVSGTAAQQTTAAAKRVPSTEDTLVRLDTWLRWYFAKNWTASLGYAWEQYWNADYRTDDLLAFNPLAGSSIWMGLDAKNYSAHLIAVTLGYRFK